ncbi:MAG: 5-(carboxyamino)imidazole ribonucleotide mutase [Acidobacteria bacterium]|nr:5-(carboxyamino)imidazole ribonucleotide mutase [Acidobacteriota bacterium]NIM63250.1 5-(carboxyamino)imidazole ribonucleotide mutase [Acidobacteriota bacterium]NIO60043.1 5-(carboxyamino)imidazole ribonucleotide mutase [Acidobacteriota bacterium]NIQ31114.1 5-(carboxyamino)imidazole ribonucleotide mutase [Acidobacteriota bacterium]NIQ86223.1 5-(carboxyamino)imidazole ribonucleotide mutase [Acidobacteriota bacterium]
MSDPRVLVMMGSDSDLPVMAEAAKVLTKLEIGHEVVVTSAHRTPERTAEIIKRAPERGVKVFIAGAGAAAHLAGVVAAHTTLPVLGVPLAASDLNGLDALLATAQMPAGIAVGTLAIGKAGAANAAWLAASILSTSDEGLAERLADERRKMAEKVVAKSEAAQTKLGELLSS